MLCLYAQVCSSELSCWKLEVLEQPSEWNNKQVMATSGFYCTQSRKRKVNGALGFIIN